MACLRLLLFLQLLVLGYSYIPPSTVQRLYSELTTGYDPRLRPTYDQSHSVWVFAMAMPYSVLELSTTDQRLTLIMYFTVVWFDSFLVWNSTEYDGIDKLAFKTDEIWQPKILVGVSYSNEHAHIGDSNGQVLVYSNGTVLWSPTSSIAVLCVMDIVFYPFDTQKCKLYLFVPYTSWDEIHLQQLQEMDLLAVFEDNPEWHLLDINATEENVGGEKALLYTYLFRRRAEFVVYTTIVPLILLSVLNACVVLVPVSSGEKGSIAVTLFLSYCVYLTAIGETLPPNSVKTSYLLLYMTIVQIFSALTMLYSIIETRMYIHGSKIAHSCLSCMSKHQQNNYRKDRAEDISDGDNSKTAYSGDSCSEEALTAYKILDNIVFAVCLVLNSAIVIVFCILTINSIQHSLE